MRTVISNLIFTALLTSVLSIAIAGPGPDSKPEKAPPVYLLTYDHGGIVLWGADQFRERLNNAISWLDKYPGFKIGLDNEAHTYDYLARYDPELLKELQGYLVKYKGRFGIGTCTYGQPLSTFIGNESNIRQIGYALEVNKKYFGYSNSIYLMSEHAMHAQLPQILDGFGFKGAIMRTHYMMYGFNPTYNSAFGNWVGMDGSKISCVPTYTGEGAEFGKTPIDNWILTRYPGPECKTTLEDFRKMFPGINPLLASRADDAGLRREGLVKQYEGNPGFRWILLDELLPLYPKPKDEYVTSPDDFTVRMPWGYCGNEIWDNCRKAEVSVLTAERLDAAATLLNNESNESVLHRSWEHLLLAQHHDIQIVGLLPDARANLDSSLLLSRRIIDKSLDYIATRIHGTGNFQVMVFNPCAWPRTEWIETRVNYSRGDAQNLKITCDGQDFPCVILEADRNSDGSILDARIAFEAASPGMGIRTYTISPVTVEQKENPNNIEIDYNTLTIQTPHLRIRLNKDGGISSITDTDGNFQVTASKERNAFFAGQINGVNCESRGRWIIEKVNEDSPYASATEYGFIADIPYTFNIRIYAGSPDILCHVSFDFNGQKIGQVSDDKRDAVSPFIHEKKLRFKFYPNLDENAIGIRDLPFVIAETSDKYIQGNYWTAVSDNKNGIAVFNKGTMCMTHEDDGGYSVPFAYAMYYIWGTRMLNGRYAYDFALHPFSGSWKDADLQRKAIDYNFPVVTRSVKSIKSSDTDHLELMETNDPGVIMSAFYIDKGNLITRFYDCDGKQETKSVRIPFRYGKIEETDFIGNVKGEFSGSLILDPWKIQTFRIGL